MISDGLIQLIDDQSGRDAGGGGSSASWDSRGEERTAETERGKEGGREGVGRCVAVCYSGTELDARHPVYRCVSVSDTGIDGKEEIHFLFMNHLNYTESRYSYI